MLGPLARQRLIIKVNVASIPFIILQIKTSAERSHPLLGSNLARRPFSIKEQL